MITITGVSTLSSGGLMLVYFDIDVDGESHHWEDVAPYLIGEDLLNLLRSRETGYVADIRTKQKAWDANKTKQVLDAKGKTSVVAVSRAEAVCSTLGADHIAKVRERERWLFAESKEAFDSLKTSVDGVK